MKKSIISSKYVGLSILILLVGGLVLLGMPNNSPAPYMPCPDGVLDPGEECDDGNLVDDDACSNECTLNPTGDCWLTVGGVKFVPLANGTVAEHGPKDSFGGNVYPGCNSDTGADGGSLTHIFHSEKIHFHGTTIRVIECGNVSPPAPPDGSESPVTPFNYIMFEGEGTIAGIKGNKMEKTDVCFDAEFQDWNEPGNEKAAAANGGEDIDRYRLRVFECPDGDTLLEIGDFENLVTLTGGNAQLHISSCDN